MSKINIINLSSYTAPDIQVDKKNPYVTFGSKNSYFQYLIDRYTGSPTNNAIVNGISQMVFGKGLSATDSNKKPEEYAQMMSLLHNDCVRKLVYDLYLMGQCAMQIIYSKDRKSIAQVEHMPVETLAMEKPGENGEIEGYYYCEDWSKIKPNQELRRIPAFGCSNENIEILYVKPYVAGYYFFSPVSYTGGLQYCELEEEISNYHLNNIMNGLAPSMLINFSNGVPSEEERANIEQRIIQKFTGSSNAGRFILSFNENAESASSIEPVPLSDAHQQYQFLSDESMRKIMVAHRIVSPMLLGIKDNSGLGNNADELREASILMDNIVIRPIQHLLLNAFEKILAYNNVTLNMYFKTLQPMEFIDLENAQSAEQVEEETGEKRSRTRRSRFSSVSVNDEFAIIDDRLAYSTPEKAQEMATNIGCEGIHEHEYEGKTWYMPCEFHNKPVELTEELEDKILENLQPDNLGAEWVETDKRAYSEDNEADELWATKNIGVKMSTLQKLADAIKSKPSGFSYLDKSFYKIRYRYMQKYNKPNSRKFCRAMMRRENAVYRIEDIDQASIRGTNKELGHKGKPYALFKYKGGVNCSHYWEQVLYRLEYKTYKQYQQKKGSADINDYEVVKEIPKSYQRSPVGSKRAAQVEADRGDRGAYPGGKKRSKR